MQRVKNPELDRLILNHLSDLYGLKTKRTGIHLSTLIYCLTKAFFEEMSPTEPTDREVMLFSLGLGLQDVLTPKQATTPVYEKDGITFSPDFVFNLGSSYVELKTTRMSISKESFPETWIEYIMGGCFIRKVNQYELAVLYMMGNYKPPFPQMQSETLVFEENELKSNWDYLLLRKKVYGEALKAKQPPQPFLHNKTWECENCRYHMQCDAIALVRGGK